MRYVIFTTFEERRYYYIVKEKFTQDITKARKFSSEKVAQKWANGVKAYKMQVLEVADQPGP